MVDAQHILLIDDDEEDCILIRDLVAAAAGATMEVVWARSYSEGIRRLLSEAFASCLVDYQIGADCGITFIESMGKMGCRVPMILLTGSGDETIDMRAQQAGAAYYVDKVGLTAASLERVLRYCHATPGNSTPVAASGTLAVGETAASPADEVFFCNGAPGESEASLRSAPQPSGDPAPCILLVEDDEDDFILARDLLREVFRSRLELDWLSGWDEALAAIAEARHDVYIVDYRLGARNGVDLVREATSLGTRAPFILLTGQGNRSIDLEAMRVGATDYLVKDEITAPLLDRSIRYAIERHRAERRLVELAQMDQLTGVANRYLFRDFLDRQIARAERHGGAVGLLLIDLDRFKAINDTYGHAAGDAVLKAVAERLRRSIRQTDLVARLGGDEFTVVMGDITAQPFLQSTVDRILDVLAEPILCDGIALDVGASIGVAIYPDDAQSGDALIASADLAMYTAKRQPNPAYHFYTGAMRDQANRRLAIERSLKDALKERQLFLLYQPQAELRSGKIVGVEALLRWQHPEFGLVPPSEFVPIAEETGAILRIGAWVLDEVCAQLAKWNAAGIDDLHVAINFAARQFLDDNLPDLVLETLCRHKIETRQIEIEITESDILQQPDEVGRMLVRFGEMGVRVSLDDFGTGYSSLTHLRSFSGSLIKIDRSFIANIPQSSNEAAIVRSLIGMAHDLGLRVVAEGVERPEQLSFLQAMDCDLMQGFLLSMPKPAEAIPELLRLSTAGSAVPEADDDGDDGAEREAEDAGGEGIDQPVRDRGQGNEWLRHEVGQVVGGVRQGVQAERFEAVQDDAAADPEHGGGADQAQETQEGRHGADDGAADRAAHRTAAIGECEADVVGLHDQRHHAIDQKRDDQADDGQDDRLGDERARGDTGKRDRHDLGREDEIGADGPLDPLRLLLGAEQGRRQMRLARLGGTVRRCGLLVPAERLDDLLGPLEAEIETAQHQERGDRPGGEEVEQQGRGQQEDELVAQRAQGDPGDHREFAGGCEAHDIARGHGGVVDDDAGRLHPRTAGLRRGVVEGRCGELRDADDIVDEPNQADAQGG